MISIFAAALLAAQPGAALLTVASCAADRASAADRQSVALTVQKGEAPEPALVERIRGHVASCDSAKAIQAEQALMATATVISRDEIGRELARSGIDPRLVERWFDRLADTAKTALAMTTEQGVAFRSAMIAGGAPEAVVDANSEKLGSYFGTLIIAERLRRGMPGT